MEEMIKFYRELFKAVNWVTSDAGYVLAKYDDNLMEVMVDQKKLALPTIEFLTKKPEMAVLFHPLKEVVSQGESPVLARFRKAMNVTARLSTFALITELLQLAASPAEHHKLTPDHLALMQKLSNVSDGTITDLAKVSAEVLHPDKPNLINIYLRPKATVQGRIHSRGAMVSFPLYLEACKDTKDLFGKKVSGKTKQIIKDLLEYLFPNIATPDAYSRGSSHETTPSLDALLRSYAALVGAINDTIRQFEDVKPSLKEFMINDAWVEDLDFDKLQAAMRLVPVQEGNTGGMINAAPAPAVATAPPAWNTPAPMGYVASPAPVSSQKDRAKSLSASFASTGVMTNFSGQQLSGPDAARAQAAAELHQRAAGR